MSSKKPLGLALATLGRGELGRAMAATRAAGFESVALSSTGIVRKAAESASGVPALRRQFADSGLRVDYLDPLFLWLGNEKPSFTLVPGERVIEWSAELGAAGINVIIGGEFDEVEAADRFARIAAAIEAVGIRPMLEFAPFLAVSDLVRATAIVQSSGIGSARILLDTWHLFRSGGVPEDIDALPAASIGALHLSDAPTSSEGVVEDLLQETMNSRLMPGDGAAQVAGVLRRALGNSPQAVVTTEVYAPGLLGQDPEGFAARCFRASKAVLELALSR